MKIISVFYTVSVVSISIFLYYCVQKNSSIPEDAKLNFTQLGSKYGLFVQEHDVVTEDGYILKLFHIPGDRDKTVLLMHGFLDSGDTFILRGNGSLVAALSSAGYDVWVGNYRGTIYSRRHKWLDPDEDNRFWDFSFHEIGAFDLPAIIDYILQVNNIEKLSAIGHSQGNMIFYVLGSTRPEYNDKINVMIALGPVCYINTENLQFPLSTLMKAGPYINNLLLYFNQEELMGPSSIMSYFRSVVCAHRLLGYTLCTEGLFFQMGGRDPPEFGPDFFYTVIEHYPTGASRKNWEHITQIAEKEFMQFDYGPSNLEHYNATSPPVYDLGNVTMKIALLVGLNDKMTPLKNVDLLRAQLPNVVLFQIMDRPNFNHIDHVWGKNMARYLYPYVMNTLDKYVGT